MASIERRQDRNPCGTAGPATSAGARSALAANVKAGAAAYNRRRDLPALVRADPFMPMPETPDAVANVVGRLERALRAERRRARSGHWTYDLNRHIALRQAFLAESERLASIRRACARDPSAWPGSISPGRNWEPPSDSPTAGSTSRDIHPE